LGWLTTCIHKYHGALWTKRADCLLSMALKQHLTQAFTAVSGQMRGAQENFVRHGKGD